MPELPEVETVRRGLEPALRGARFLHVEQRRSDLRFPLPERFVERLTGRRVERLERRAKYILMHLDSEEVLAVHLGMTGRFTVSGGRPGAALGEHVHRAGRDAKHDHLVFTMSRGAIVTYNDARRFGRLAVIAPEAVVAETAAGVDALSDGFTAGFLHAGTRRHRRTTVKSLLMDQREIAGLGNIYVNEILFRAGVRPRRRAGRLTRAECAAVVEAIRPVLHGAIERGGSSISDYRDGFERFGSYQDDHVVYDRSGEPCLRCGSPIRSCVVAGRSTFYCARCQR